MRIAIFGTGAVGGNFGAQLARAGEDVVFIARGEHLDAIRNKGLRVDTSKEEIVIHPAQATDDPAGVGVVDVVLVGVKAWQVSDAAHAMRPLVGPETTVVPLQNGIEAPSQLAAVLGPDRVLGGLCGTFSRVTSFGHIQSMGDMDIVWVGELDNRPSERIERLRHAFERTAVKFDTPPDIHQALWRKFLLVAAFGGVGAVTRAPIGVMRTLPGTRCMLEDCMGEASAVARARGVSLPEGVVAGTLALIDSLPADGKSSLQQDIADGRRSELEALNGALVRLGLEASVATPVNEFIYQCLLPLELRARGDVCF